MGSTVVITVILLVLLLVLLVAIATLAVIAFRGWHRHPGFRLPGFNIFTGRWSDDEQSGGRD
ncbi:MAG: hypothetical protein M0Z87_01355 [Actinomycetota bacterium]|nr:hypothetical protein [Actinomycetota bacterium]